MTGNEQAQKHADERPAPEESVAVSEEIELTGVTFDSGGVELAGYFYRP